MLRARLGVVVIGLIGLIVMGASAGHADSRKSARVPGTDLVLGVSGGAVTVTSGKTTAIIPRNSEWPDLLLDLDVTRSGATVVVSVGLNCSGEWSFKTTVDALRARIANTEALRLHKQQKWDEAAAGFVRALSLDPDLELAALNLASAQARGGKRAAAVATLVALAGKNPTLAVWRAYVDAELVDLAGAAELAPFAAAQAGQLDAKALGGPIHAREKNLWAYVTTLTNSMSEEDRPSSELRIVDARSDKVVVRESWSGDARQLAALRALGFSNADLEAPELGEPDYSSDPNVGKRKGYFGKAKLGIVIAPDGAVRVLRGNRVLGEGSVGGASNYAFWLTPLGLVIRTRVNIGDGCGGWNYDAYALVKLAAP